MLHNTILKVSECARFLSVQFFKFWRKHIHLCFMSSLHCYFPVSLISVSMYVCLSFFSTFLLSFLLLFTLLCFSHCFSKHTYFQSNSSQLSLCWSPWIGAQIPVKTSISLLVANGAEPTLRRTQKITTIGSVSAPISC